MKTVVANMITKLGHQLSEAVREKIRTCKESLALRVEGREKAFTRDRLLTAERIVSMIITPARQSLQTRLKEFGVKFMDGVVPTKQAFSKQRQFVNPDFIREFYDEGAEVIINDGDLITFKGLHLTGVDGSRIACENTPELIEEFGCSGSKKSACTALASVAYDLIERVSFDCQIGSYSLSERELLDRHLDRLETFGAGNFLIVGDRGYPSYDLMGTMIDKGFKFLLRLSESWSNVISQLEDTEDKVFRHERNGNVYEMRVLKIELEDKTEYLVTNLEREILSIDEAKHIYSLRWNIETFFGVLKTELELENFSGKTKVAVLQEFYATMAIANICLCNINDADKKIADADSKKTLKYSRQANRRQCIGEIVPVFLECIFTDSKRKRDRLWKDVERYCERFSEPVRPGRNPARKIPRDKKFYANARKPSLS
jgi:hypothetical protein